MRSLAIALFVAVSTSALANTLPPPVTVPDMGSTSLLLVTALAGLVAGRKFLGRR
jgi:hypothetical protein